MVQVRPLALRLTSGRPLVLLIKYFEGPGLHCTSICLGECLWTTHRFMCLCWSCGDCVSTANGVQMKGNFTHWSFWVCPRECHLGASSGVYMMAFLDLLSAQVTLVHWSYLRFDIDDIIGHNVFGPVWWLCGEFEWCSVLSGFWKK